MKRFRVKVIGLGLALAAGTAVATGADWRAPGSSAPEALPAAPGLLPQAMRGASAKADGPIWVPTRQSPAVDSMILPAGGGGAPAPSFVPAIPPAVPVPVPPAPTPPVSVQQPPAPPPPAPPQPQPTAPDVGPLAGPRGSGAFGPLPAIPMLPDATESHVALPVVPRPAAPTVPVRQPNPIPSPRPVEPPMMLPPHAPDFLPPRKPDPAPQPLPQPRPVDPKPGDTQPELQPAPAELMIPDGAMTVGGKHQLFGSPPIRLSRDYPPIRDLVQNGHSNNGDITIVDEAAAAGPFNRYFVRGEYLLWWVPGFATPVLGTTNANTALNGYLGEQGTTALFGPGGFVGSTRSGLRIRAGAWLDDCGSCGIDGSFFFLGSRSATLTTNSDQNPLITRPVFVPNFIPGTSTPLGENGEAVAVPGILRGALTVRGDSQLWGADVNLRKSLLNCCDVRAEVFAGYRFLNLRENLSITEDITVIGPGGNRIALMDPLGTHVVVQDHFQTQNYFNGGQIGGLFERRMGRWSWDTRGSFAIGSTHQVLEIDGFQNRQPPGMDPMVFRGGGLLAAGSNIGRFTRDKFSVVPEFSLNVGYFVLPNLRLYAGYNFILWTNVIRPGDQIDHTVDLTLVPNALPSGFSGQYRPRPLFKQSDLVVNGIQFGLDWRW